MALQDPQWHIFMAATTYFESGALSQGQLCSQEALATSGGLLGCPKWRYLVGWSPDMLLSILQCSGQPPTKNALVQNINRPESGKPRFKDRWIIPSCCLPRLVHLPYPLGILDHSLMHLVLAQLPAVTIT